jgi:hypothetical protein
MLTASISAVMPSVTSGLGTAHPRNVRFEGVEYGDRPLEAAAREFRRPLPITI